jgi:Flp pilus assembly protein TadG
LGFELGIHKRKKKQTMKPIIIRIKAIAAWWPDFRGKRKGQTLVLMLLVLPAFVGALGLAMDVGNFYYQYYRAQEAVDAAALAGATCQADSTKCTAGGSTTATNYATTNDPNMTLLPNPVAAPFFNTTYCNPGAPSFYTTPCEVTVSATQTVPYYFARLVGVNNGTFDVSATAVGGPPNTYNPGGGTTNMMPIGLDWTTPYKDGKPISLAFFQSPGSGNWGFILPQAETGKKDLGTDIKNGVQSSMSIWNGSSTPTSGSNQFVTTQSASGIGKSFTDINTYHYSSCAGQTPSNDPSSACLVCIPLVDWSYAGASGCGGATCTVPIKGFAEFFITSVTAPSAGGTGTTANITATWQAGLCGSSGFGQGGTPPPQQGAIAVQLIQ